MEFRRRVRAALLSTSISNSTGPMIVHCKYATQCIHYSAKAFCCVCPSKLAECCYSDGGGRSGVFMAIDANMELVEEDGLIDIFGYMKKLRQARRGLVETLVSCIFNIRRIVDSNRQRFVEHDDVVITGAVQIYLRYTGGEYHVRMVLVPSFRAFDLSETKVHPQSRHETQRVPAGVHGKINSCRWRDHECS